VTPAPSLPSCPRSVAAELRRASARSQRVQTDFGQLGSALTSEEHRQYLRVHVTHLRQKIERSPTNPTLIKTEPGVGYRFAADFAG